MSEYGWGGVPWGGNFWGSAIVVDLQAPPSLSSSAGDLGKAARLTVLGREIVLEETGVTAVPTAVISGEQLHSIAGDDFYFYLSTELATPAVYAQTSGVDFWIGKTVDVGGVPLQSFAGQGDIRTAVDLLGVEAPVGTDGVTFTKLAYVQGVELSTSATTLVSDVFKTVSGKRLQIRAGQIGKEVEFSVGAPNGLTLTHEDMDSIVIATVAGVGLQTIPNTLVSDVSIEIQGAQVNALASRPESELGFRVPTPQKLSMGANITAKARGIVNVLGEDLVVGANTVSVWGWKFVDTTQDAGWIPVNTKH